MMKKLETIIETNPDKIPVIEKLYNTHSHIKINLLKFAIKKGAIPVYINKYRDVNNINIYEWYRGKNRNILTSNIPTDFVYNGYFYHIELNSNIFFNHYIVKCKVENNMVNDEYYIDTNILSENTMNNIFKTNITEDDIQILWEEVINSNISEIENEYEYKEVPNVYNNETHTEKVLKKHQYVNLYTFDLPNNFDEYEVLEC